MGPGELETIERMDKVEIKPDHLIESLLQSRVVQLQLQLRARARARARPAAQVPNCAIFAGPEELNGKTKRRRRRLTTLGAPLVCLPTNFGAINFKSLSASSSHFAPEIAYWLWS